MSAAIPLRRTVRNVTVKADCADFKVALEDIVGWTGELRITGTEYEGSGIAFQSGDVLLGKLRPNLAKVWLADRPGAAVGDFLVLRPEGDLTGRALRDFLLQRNTIDYLAATAYGSKMPRTSWELVGCLSLPISEPKQQCAIADFLDRETAEIDEFVAESEKLITLLNERRAAVITQAVTKGLDPAAPMKDTGIEGVGQVPSHWRVARISWLFGETASGTTPEAGELVSGHEADIPWVTSGELREANLLSTSKGISVETLSRYSALTIHPPGSLLIAMYGATIGRMCILGVAAASNQAVCALRHPIDSNVSFVLFALLAARERLLLDAAGGGQPNINQDKVRAFRLPVPDKVEQDEIVAYLSNQTAKIDEAIETAREAIALAKERRQALISAAVTGKIDVRAAA